MKLLALVACACVGFGCGMRTELLSSLDAQVVQPPRDGGPKNPDLPLDLPLRRDGPPGPLPPDLRPADLAIETPVDLKPPLPDAPTDRGPDRFPDLAPDLRRDVPPDLRTDLPRDGTRDLLPELPPDRPPDLRPMPDRPMPDRPMDVRTDLLRDGTPDFLPELPPDRPGDRFVDLPADLSSGLETACSSGSTLACTCDNGLAGSRICLPSLVFSECGCGTDALMRIKNGLIGTWTGTATTPWVPTYHVTFTFDSYTHYASRALDGDGTPALYYGSDQDSPLKRYEITDVQANGDAVGTLDVYFSDSSTSRSKLQGVQLSADLSHLKFYFMHLEQYGPLQYDLQRTSP